MKKLIILITIFCFFLAWSYWLYVLFSFLVSPEARVSQQDFGGIKTPLSETIKQCDNSLWQHVYTGDPRRFHKPQDRLKIIKDCIAVTGTIKSAKAEKDGDFHIQLAVDPQFKGLLNEKNKSGQKGYLVLEPVCENPVTQKDTLKEGVCKNFKQTVFTKDMIGKHVEVIGVYVEDQEHGWREVHPTTSIKIK